MTMHFNFTDMRLFVSIAEHSSFTNGARHCHMSLPAASTRIKNLEESIGTLLLYRSKKGVQLTPAGKTFAEHARGVQQQIEHLRGDLQQYVAGVKGHIRVFANTTAMTEFLPSVLRGYLALHPDVSIDMREHLSGEIVAAVAEGRADIGVTCGTVGTEALEVLPYRRDNLVLAVPRDHPLCAWGPIEFSQTLKFDHVGMDEGSALHSFLIQRARELGHIIRPRVQVRNFEAMCRMVEAGVGIGILPESAARRYEERAEICILGLSDEWAVRQLQICTRSQNLLAPFANDLIAALQRDAATQSEGAARPTPRKRLVIAA